MSCRIIRNNNGIVEDVLAPNGKSSKLYRDALAIVKNKEQALKLWAVAYIPGFNKWFSNLNAEEPKTIKPGVAELFESNFLIFAESKTSKNKNNKTTDKITQPSPSVIVNNGEYLNLSEEKKQEIFENYVNLMDRKREGKAISKDKFELMFKNLQVFNYKDTYIFGEWDTLNNVFKGRLMSSPGIKELYSALDVLFEQVDFMASVPEDIGKMLEKKGLYKLNVDKPYNFRGEEMIKNLYFSNEKLARKIFKKSIDKITEEDILKYDTFYNRNSIISDFLKSYIPYSIRMEQKSNPKKDVSTTTLNEIKNILSKKTIDLTNLYYLGNLITSFKEFIQENKEYASRNSIFDSLLKEIEKIKVDVMISSKTDKKFEYVSNENLLKAIDKSISEKLDVNILNIKVPEQNFYEKLKSLGIYDYNAYRLANKIISGRVTEDDKITFVNDLLKNSSLNKVAIDKQDLLNNPKIYSELDTELNKTLATFLSKFGVTTKVLEDFQSEFNIDSFATVDILNKTIYTSKNNQTEYPQQAAMLIAYMMQHNPLITEIKKDMRKYAMFKDLSQDEMLNAIGDMIAEQLYKKTNTEIPKSLIDKIKLLISQFISNLTSLKISRLNKNVGFIADNILLQNQSLITASVYKPGAQGKKVQQIALEEALKSDDFGADIVEEMADYFILTGSISFSEQGVTLRPNENQIHDLDWVSPYSKNTTVEIFEKLYPDSKYIRNIKSENNETDTWLVAPKGYTIENLVLSGSNNIVEGYDIMDKNGNVVSSYVKEKDEHTGEISAKLIDVFTYQDVKLREKDSYVIPYTLPSGKVLSLSDWRITFAAKLRYGRLKDIWDYNRFIPVKRDLTENSSRFLDENSEPTMEAVSLYMLNAKNNVQKGFVENNSGLTFTTDNPLFNKCAK